MVIIMLKFINYKREYIWIENFTSFDTYVTVHYKGDEHKYHKKHFGTKIFPIDKKTKNLLRNTFKMDVDIPSFVHDVQNDGKTTNSGENHSFYISPNGTCLKKMDWDFD